MSSYLPTVLSFGQQRIFVMTLFSDKSFCSKIFSYFGSGCEGGYTVGKQSRSEGGTQCQVVSIRVGCRFSGLSLEDRGSESGQEFKIWIYRVYGLEFGVWRSTFKVLSLGLTIWSVGFKV